MSQATVAEEQEPYLKILGSIEAEILCGKFPRGSRLPSENQLVELYHENVYNIRKAVNALKEKGFLYSKPKLGVFVAETERSAGVENRIHIRLSTRSSRPVQRNLWKKLSESMENSFEHSVLEVVYPGILEHHLPGADLYEFSGIGADCFSKHLSFLPLREYFSSVLTSAPQMKNDSFLPFGYAPLNLFFNRDLLKKLRMPDPVFSDYDSQLEWLEETAKRTAEHPDLFFPQSAFYPFLLFGSYSEQMFADLSGERLAEAAFLKKYRDLFRKTTEFSRKYRIARPNPTADNVRRFLEGKMPCLSAVGNILSEYPVADFHSGSAMMYAADNRSPIVPLLFAIAADTDYPIECIRLIRTLSGKEYSRNLADAGFIPAADRSILPKMDYPIPYNRQEPLQPGSKEEFYVLLNILNVELEGVILEDKPLDEAIRNYYLFSTAYLKMKHANKNTACQTT